MDTTRDYIGMPYQEKTETLSSKKLRARYNLALRFFRVLTISGFLLASAGEIILSLYKFKKVPEKIQNLSLYWISIMTSGLALFIIGFIWHISLKHRAVIEYDTEPKSSVTTIQHTDPSEECLIKSGNLPVQKSLTSKVQSIPFTQKTYKATYSRRQPMSSYLCHLGLGTAGLLLTSVALPLISICELKKAPEKIEKLGNFWIYMAGLGLAMLAVSIIWGICSKHAHTNKREIIIGSWEGLLSYRSQPEPRPQPPLMFTF